MEYCHRGDLCSHIKKQNGKFLSDNFVWKVFIHITLGLQYLHAQNIIHRDLKSLNIFLSKDNSAKLGDFGCARKLDSHGKIIEDEPNEHKVGTPFYLAPEIWNDQPCTKKTDVWALGVILHEMCALTVPFLAEDIESLSQKVLNQKPSLLPHSVNKSFQKIIQRCLLKKPELRATVEEIILMDDFQEKCKLLKITLPSELNKSKIAKREASQAPSSPHKRTISNDKMVQLRKAKENKTDDMPQPITK